MYLFSHSNNENIYLGGIFLQELVKELRIHHEFLYEIPQNKLDNYQTITLGHSGCHYKIMGIQDHHINFLLNKGKKVKIELPILFQQSIENVIQHISKFFHYEINLIVNDWGALYYFSKEKLPSNISLSLGRQLVFNYSNCPWYEDILQSESEEIKQHYLQLNINNQSIINILKEMGVSEVDTDINIQMKDSIHSLREAGIKVNGFLGYPITSTSRACHALGYYGGELGKCQHLCNEGILIEPRESWNRFEDSTLKISKENRDKLGKLIVYGNVVIQDTEWKDNVLPFEIDSISHDARFSPIYMNQEVIK